MIARVVRGHRMSGLLAYLAGPGKANEHTDQRIVAADDVVLARHPAGPINREDALRAGRVMDRPRRAHDVNVARGHVWHCSLSLPPNAGRLSDEQWGAIARDVVAGLGYTEGPDRAACRWVAVRHGASENGNDHIHLVVNLVRDDGSTVTQWPLRKDGEVVDTWKDFAALSQVVTEVERKHGLEVLAGREIGRGAPGITAAEHAKTARTNAPEPDRVSLARTVRASAATAADESDFVRRMRDAGLLIRPRYAKGRTDAVEGYSVAQRPREGQRPVWFGGGRLGRDLTLPRLRQTWPDTPQHADDAVTEWTVSSRRQPTTRRAAADVEADPRDWLQATRDLAQLRDQLRDVPPDDHAQWARTAGAASGVFAAWSARVEQKPGPLAATSDQLARSAQIRAGRTRGHQTPPGFRRAARLLAGVTRATSHGGQAELLIAVANIARALHDAHRASQDARRAREIADVVRGELAGVAKRLDTGRVPQPPTSTAARPPAARRPRPAPGQDPGRGFGR